MVGVSHSLRNSTADARDSELGNEKQESLSGLALVRVQADALKLTLIQASTTRRLRIRLRAWLRQAYDRNSIQIQNFLHELALSLEAPQQYAVRQQPLARTYIGPSSPHPLSMSTISAQYHPPRPQHQQKLVIGGRMSGVLA